jgi:hypothetical protein
VKNIINTRHWQFSCPVREREGGGGKKGGRGEESVVYASTHVMGT